MDLNKTLNSNLHLKVLPVVFWKICVSQDRGDACDFQEELSPVLKG